MKRNPVFIFLSVLIVIACVALLVIVRHTASSSFFIAEGLLALCLLLLWVFYARLVKPINTIANGMDLLREQDFSSRLSPVGQSDADRLVDIFNRMMASLKEERLRVREQNHFLDLLIAASPMGIIILDDDDRVTMVNDAALKFLDADAREALAGKRVADLDSPLSEALVTLPQDTTTTLRLSDSMIYRCARLSFMDKGYAHPFIMIEKLTDEVMKAEKFAYEKVIRMMAHEVNNSVAGVSSVLETASMISEDPDMAEALDVCRHRCESMSRFITSFADVVKIPAPRLEACDLNVFVADTLPLLESLCTVREINLVFRTSPEAVTVMLDKVQMEQVLINLVKNAAESIGTEGEITVSVAGHEICIADNGAGIDKETRQKIFTPFFSSKADGRGLGLLFVSEVLNGHGCTFSLRTYDDGLTRFLIRFQP